MATILGILNVTRDSFSDGGRHFDPVDALLHAMQLVADGAAIVDVGAESTHPDSEDITEEEEIRRLAPVVKSLVAEGVTVSVDTYRPGVMRHVLGLGAGWINDVNGFRDPDAIAAVRDGDARVVVMHSIAAAARAERRPAPDDVVGQIERFFSDRVSALEAAGVGSDRIVLDPGMGFFLGAGPDPSLSVLKHLRKLRSMGYPLLVSTTRKSFIGAVTGRAVAERGAGTLATEIWAIQQGVEFVRTHDVRALTDALAMLQAIEASR